jgi:DNA-nicking Smr family endonuclease
MPPRLPPPAAEFDLHGLPVLDAALSSERFLEAQRRARPGAAVRLITGRGQGGGQAPIRRRIGALLRKLKSEGRIVQDYELEATEGSYLIRLAR